MTNIYQLLLGLGIVLKDFQQFYKVSLILSFYTQENEGAV